MLEYRSITKKFGNKEAVKELTLNLQKGHDLWASWRKRKR